MANKVYPQHFIQQQKKTFYCRCQNRKTSKEISKKTFVLFLTQMPSFFGAMKSVCINISMMALLHYSQKTRRQRQRKDEEERILRREYKERENMRKFLYFIIKQQNICLLRRQESLALAFTSYRHS